jgi:hypothetical protein
MYEFHSDMPSIGPCRWRVAERNEPATANKPLGHAMTEPGNAFGFSREKRFYRSRARIE